MVNEYPQRLDHVVWKVIEGRGILLNLEDGAYFEVGPVGLSIWEKCDGKRRAESIVDLIAREFRTDSKRVQRDFAAFVAELKRRKLLRLSPMPVAIPTRLKSRRAR